MLSQGAWGPECRISDPSPAPCEQSPGKNRRERLAPLADLWPVDQPIYTFHKGIIVLHLWTLNFGHRWLCEDQNVFMYVFKQEIRRIRIAAKDRPLCTI